VSFKKLFVSSIIIGILAGFIMLITNFLQSSGFISNDASLTFVTFIAWSCYFFSGGTPKDAVISWLSFVVGIICAIIIFICSDLFSFTGMNTAYIALPLAVVVGVILMCLAERLPFGNRVPSVYLGAATFFGLMGIPAVSEKGFLIVGIGELVYAIFGLVAGYLTVTIIRQFQSSTDAVSE